MGTSPLKDEAHTVVTDGENWRNGDTELSVLGIHLLGGIMASVDDRSNNGTNTKAKERSDEYDVRIGEELQ